MDEKIGIYVDDRRIPTEVPPTISEWVVVKNYEEFRDLLYEYIRAYKKVPYLISFDHDLADEHYVFHSMNPPGTQPDYMGFKEKTGAHCAKLLTTVCEKNNLEIYKVCVHSENVIGGDNIQWWINNWKKEHKLEQDCFRMKFKFKNRPKDEEQKEEDPPSFPAETSEGEGSTPPVGDIPALG